MNGPTIPGLICLQQGSDASQSCGSRRPTMAFTLVEMLLAVVMLGVLVGGLAALLGGRQETYSTSAFARDLASAIHFASTESKLANRQHQVAFIDQPLQYRIEKLGLDSEDFIPVQGMAGQLKSVPAGMSVVLISKEGHESPGWPEALVFDGHGQGFNGKLKLTNSKNKSIIIEVAQGTGQVNVVE